MKKRCYSIFIILTLASANVVLSQCASFSNLLWEGDQLMYASQIPLAIRKYCAAIIDCPDRIDEVSGRFYAAFNRIEQMRVKAIEDRKIIKSLNDSIELQNDSLSILAKSLKERLVQLSYSAKNLEEARGNLRNQIEQTAFETMPRIYLASDTAGKGLRYYYFIDFVGDSMGHLGKWDEATPFRMDGFAVVADTGGRYLLESSGRCYPLFAKGRQGGLVPLALDIQGLRLKRLQKVHREWVGLKVVTAGDNNIRRLNRFLRNLDSLEQLLVPDNNLHKFPKLKSLEPLVLRRLNLAGNEIRKIPDGISDLQFLNYLNVSNNYLEEVPGTITNLNLQFLNLSHNFLSDWPKEGGGLGDGLVVLDISFNSFVSLPRTIFEFENLHTLNLTGNELEFFPNDLLKMESLKRIQIGENPCSDSPEERRYILDLVWKFRPDIKVGFM